MTVTESGRSVSSSGSRDVSDSPCSLCRSTRSTVDRWARLGGFDAMMSMRVLGARVLHRRLDSEEVRLAGGLIMSDVGSGRSRSSSPDLIVTARHLRAWVL